MGRERRIFRPAPRPVGPRDRAGASRDFEVRRDRTETPSGRVGGRGTRLPTAPGSGIGNSLAQRGEPASRCASICERGVPPFTLSPRLRAANRRFAATFFRLLGAPPPLLRQPEYERGNAGLQTGTAHRRAAKRVHPSIPQGALQRERLQETPTLTSLGEPQPTKPGGGSRRPGNVHPLRRHPTGAPQASDI